MHGPPGHSGGELATAHLARGPRGLSLSVRGFLSVLTFVRMRDVVLEGHWGASLPCSWFLAEEPKTGRRWLAQILFNCLLCSCSALCLVTPCSVKCWSHVSALPGVTASHTYITAPPRTAGSASSRRGPGNRLAALGSSGRGPRWRSGRAVLDRRSSRCKNVLVLWVLVFLGS